MRERGVREGLRERVGEIYRATTSKVRERRGKNFGRREE